ncbi:T9SS type A sorting domain-containing protein [Spirosoma endbachense]|uniref:T9SS type A sorting domain-containing protein n=1 Tax=Spirosoma endbachense TaxID=2666025 RepID=A0A6P1VTR0_9BACT|nr:T9SS type A sorting domain-containing protein [Spirosoma endbachense]QHV95482.1 T9SS type A sorting domain-containing protein [Spirosoma endbachense]
MKKTVILLRRFVPALFIIGSVSGIATAQKAGSSTKNDEVNVRIIERNGDEVRETERTYHVNGLTDPERDRLVMKLVDSLKTARKDKGGKRQMTIIVEDNDGDRIVKRERITPRIKRAPNDIYVQRGKIPRLQNDQWGKDGQTWRYEFRRGADSLADRLNRFKMQIPRDWDQQLVRPFEDWSRNFTSKPSTIRGLDAYPNNPDRGQLNVRFTAPAKGDVSIIVTNPKGKEVARREIKDFSGEFVGQIDLGKNTQGAYFITVTQNEDGAVKRIVIDTN